MGTMLLGAGAAHFLVPAQFDWMVPVELPGSQRFYTHASGVAEIATGTLLSASPTRRFGATVAVALFIAFYRPMSTACASGGTSHGGCGWYRSCASPCRYR
jgi:uncharacterized membrane protein